MKELPTLLVLLLLHVAAEATFTINYEKNSFYMDGKPFRYVSGSAHYFRMPHQYWRDRLRKMRAGGLNAVSTYVEWSQHEPVPGKYNFDGDLNVTKFIEIAREEGLYVILRPGPYICAERDMGGLPYWLLTKNPKISLRSSDPTYTAYVEKWLNVLLPKISPYLFGNGGPIIMVQVENEYGLYHVCDKKHNVWLRDLFKRHIQDKAVLFTTDPPQQKVLACGKIPDVYATVDFGPEVDVDKAFAMQRSFEPRGPFVNSEYYPGWLTHWGEKMARKSTDKVVATLRKMLSKGASVNFYMYFGGTNFGFTAGANYMSDYVSDITSYDYNAPLTEAGDLTEKYEAIKKVIAEFLPPPPGNITVKTSGKGDYGEHTLSLVATLMSPYVRQTMGVKHFHLYPQTFETLDQNFGYMMYETDIRKDSPTPKHFRIRSYNDFANVYVDGQFLKSLSRERRETEFSMATTKVGQLLTIVVENLGRVNFESRISEMKGILSNVTKICTTEAVMDKWNMTGFAMTTVKPIVDKCFEGKPSPACSNGQGFHFYGAKFAIPANATRNEYGHLLDSFLDVSGLTKGLVFVNDFNLGRYWSTRGPQYTLYVPGVYLKASPEVNTLVVMDENIKLKDVKLKFIKSPKFIY